MSVAYFDCFAGASGDMILGALLDAGLQLETLREALRGLPLHDWELDASRIVTGGLAATHVRVTTQDRSTTRSYRDLDSLLASSQLDADVERKSGRILRRLAEAESHLHNLPLDQVHLHELGGVDTLIDIVGAVVGLSLMKVEEIYVSDLPLGAGSVSTRHGTLPLPAPATVELLRGAPVRAVDIQAELVTPTGAAILTTLARGYSTFPTMTLTGAGYGAGSNELSIPNFLRVLIGTPLERKVEALETLVILETNIDDMNPQLYDHVMDRLFEAGALDVWLSPIQMKKNRPGTLLAALCRPEAEALLASLFLKETTTLGVRRREVQRHALVRETRSVKTTFGSVHVKVALLHGEILRAQPEYEECRKLAETNRVPLIAVYQAVQEAYLANSEMT